MGPTIAEMSSRVHGLFWRQSSIARSTAARWIARRVSGVMGLSDQRPAGGGEGDLVLDAVTAREVATAETAVCLDCRALHLDGHEPELRQRAGGDLASIDFPAIDDGSERQIAWAAKLRNELIERVNIVLARLGEDRTAADARSEVLAVRLVNPYRAGVKSTREERRAYDVEAARLGTLHTSEAVADAVRAAATQYLTETHSAREWITDKSEHFACVREMAADNLSKSTAA